MAEPAVRVRTAMRAADVRNGTRRVRFGTSKARPGGIRPRTLVRCRVGAARARCSRGRSIRRTARSAVGLVIAETADEMPDEHLCRGRPGGGGRHPDGGQARGHRGQRGVVVPDHAHVAGTRAPRSANRTSARPRSRRCRRPPPSLRRRARGRRRAPGREPGREGAQHGGVSPSRAGGRQARGAAVVGVAVGSREVDEVAVAERVQVLDGVAGRLGRVGQHRGNAVEKAGWSRRGGQLRSSCRQASAAEGETSSSPSTCGARARAEPVPRRRLTSSEAATNRATRRAAPPAGPP